jgi:hypothetical protein
MAFGAGGWTVLAGVTVDELRRGLGRVLAGTASAPGLGRVVASLL